MSPRYRSIVPGVVTVTVTVDGRPLEVARGRSLLAALLLSGRPGAAADFNCAIGQCQRCLVTVDGRQRLACQYYPAGGEVVLTAPVDGRPLPWE